MFRHEISAAKKVWGFGPNRPSRCLEGGLVTTFSVAKLFMFVEVFVMGCSPWNLTIPVDAKKIQVCSYWSCSFDLGPKRQIVFNVGAKGCVSKFSWGDSPPTQTEKKHILGLASYTWAITPLHPMGVFHSFPLANRQAIMEVRTGLEHKASEFRVSTVTSILEPKALEGHGGQTNGPKKEDLWKSCFF